MNYKVYFFAFWLTLLLGSLQPILACSCSGAAPVCEAFGDAKAVFVGEVLGEQKTQRYGRDFAFRVKRNFLGAEAEKTITIRTGSGGGDCGFPFQKGETYLVYAYGEELTTGICTRTRHVSRAEDDFEELKYLLLTSGAKIYGSVNLYAKIYPSEERFQPMPGVKLQVEQAGGEQKKFELLSDNQGKFQLNGLPAGRYRVVPSLMSGLKIEDYETREFLLNARGCARKDFFVKNDSRIIGKVIDAEGKPVNGIWIDLIPVNFTIKPKSFGALDNKAYASGIGKFHFFNVPPGKYFIAANYSSVPSEKAPYPTSFYRTDDEPSDRTIVEIGLGQKIENLVLKLPPLLSMQEIHGKVILENGKAPPKATVYLRDAEARQNISSVETDKAGNFVLKGRAGRKYSVTAYGGEIIRDSNSDLTFEFQSEAVEFILDDKTGEFKIILIKQSR